MLINTANLQQLFTGFKTAFNLGYSQVPTIWPQVATLVPSATEMEIYAWLGEWPEFREWIGDRHIKSLKANKYTLANKSYESTIGVPKNKLEDDTYGVFRPMFEGEGQAAARHPDRLLIDAVIAGTTELCYDGQYFFDTDHPVGATTVANYDSAGGGQAWYLLCTAHSLKPFIYQRRQGYEFTRMTDLTDEAVFMRKEYRYGVDARGAFGYGFWQMAYCSKQTLNGTNFDAAYNALLAMASDQGRNLGIMPDLLLVGRSNRVAAETLLDLQFDESGASNRYYKRVPYTLSQLLP